MPLQRYAFSSMGCPCEIQIEADDLSIAHVAANKARAEVARLDGKYSHYRADNWLARLCATAGSGRSVELDEEAANLIDFAATLHAQSAGRFDITAGALT